MKVVIIEDEKLAAEKLVKLLKKINPEIQILEIVSSVKSGLKWFNSNEIPELIFSDIQLGDGLSFDIFSNLNLPCPIIFLTAFDQYAIKAFEVNSVDYLLKPVKEEDISKSLEKYELKKKAWNAEDNQLNVDVLLSAINEARHNYKSRFLVKLGNKIHTVKTEEIAYFYSDSKLTFLVDREGSKYPLDQSLEELSQQLNPDLFFRVNRKYLIHLDSAEEINPYFKGRLKLNLRPETDDDVIVSSDKTPSFKEWLDR